MKIQLDLEDVVPQYRGLPSQAIKVEHLTDNARAAILVARCEFSYMGRIITPPSLLQTKVDAVSAWGPNERNNGGLEIQWSGPIGFGELTIVLKKDDTVYVGDEMTGPGFAEMLLAKLLQGATLECQSA